MLGKRGFLLYDVLLSLVVIITVMLYLIIPFVRLKLEIKNQQYIAGMKQALYANLILYENGEALLTDAEYTLKIADDKLCITFIDLFKKEREYCEQIWV